MYRYQQIFNTSEWIGCTSTDEMYKGKKVWVDKDGNKYIMSKIHLISFFIPVNTSK